MNYSLLPNNETFLRLLKPYLIPYLLYTGLGMLSNFGVPEWLVQLVKFVSVSISLVLFRKYYQFGQIKLWHLIVSLIATPALLCFWIYPFQFFLGMSGETVGTNTGLNSIVSADLYFYLRLVNSVFLVAIFEELFCRVYLFEYFYRAQSDDDTSFVDRLLSPLDYKPQALQTLPFSWFSVVGATLCFTAGHSTLSYVSAILYFTATNYLYWRTRSLWVCIFTHSFTNLVIALLVKFRGMNELWF